MIRSVMDLYSSVRKRSIVSNKLNMSRPDCQTVNYFVFSNFRDFAIKSKTRWCCISVTRPNRVRFRQGSCVHSQGIATPLQLKLPPLTGPLPAIVYPHTGGRRYMVNRQFPWLALYSQQAAPGLSWRTEMREVLAVSGCCLRRSS